MQKATALLPSWDKTKSSSKKGFDKVWGWADKLGAPVNRLTNKIGSEAFWPTTLDKESDKAARILRSFCSEYFLPCWLHSLVERAVEECAAGRPSTHYSSSYLKSVADK
jgi:hypothetical protein